MVAAESICLVLEFSGRNASIAVIRSPFSAPECLAETFSEGRNHLEQALSLIQSTLDQAQRKLADLTDLAVPSGPGSFTGLRVGLATAKGLARRLQIPIHTVNGAEMRALRMIRKEQIQVLTPASSQRVTRSLFKPKGPGLELIEEGVVAATDVQNADGQVELTAQILGLGLIVSSTRKTFSTEETRALIDAEYFGTRF